MIDTTVIQQDKRNGGGLLITAAGIVGLIYTIESQNPPDITNEDTAERYFNRLEMYPYMIYGLLTLGGIILTTDNKEKINEEKTE